MTCYVNERIGPYIDYNTLLSIMITLGRTEITVLLEDKSMKEKLVILIYADLNIDLAYGP